MTRRWFAWAIAGWTAIACAPSDGDPPAGSNGPATTLQGTAPPAVSGIPSVVLLRPFEGEHSPGSATTDGFVSPLVVDQFGMAFSPTRGLAPVGVPIDFTNSEAIPHNVRIRDMAADSVVFDSDTDPDQRVAYTPTHAGGYGLSCSMHPGMTGFFYATDAPLGTTAAADGSFALGLPAGRYTIRIWSADPRLTMERDIRVAPGVNTFTP